MNSYELTVVLPGKVTPANKKKAVEMLTKLVKVNGGTLGKLDDWGEKQLAYKMAKNDSGSFLHFPLELPPEGAKALLGKLNLEEGIIRYLLIRAEASPGKQGEEKKTVKSKKKAKDK